MDKQTVYSITVGMLPTVGFARRDFEPDRVGEWRANKARGSSLGIRGVIGSDGSLRKARIRGSVAWFEYSTTAKAIQEMVGEDALEQSHTEWEAMASEGQKALYNDFITSMGIEDMAPTGEKVTGAVKGEQPSEQPAHWSAGKEDTDSNKKMREEGRLVGQAKGIDLYFRGKDNKIYRVDVTSQTMDSRAHHGLTGKDDRIKAKVTSSHLLELVGKGPAGIATAEKRLLKYFQKTQTGWNKVIERLKAHLRGGQDETLRQLESGETSLKDQNVLQNLQDELKADLGQSTKTSFLNRLRGTKRQSIRRMRQDASGRLGTGAKSEAFHSAVEFALHMLGNIIEIFSKDSGVMGGYSTEFRVGSGIPMTIEVKHKIIASGDDVLLFEKLRQQDVILHKEAALQHVYMRDVMDMERSVQNEIINTTSEKQSEMYASLGMLHDGAGVEIGGVTATLQSGLAKDGNNVYQRGTTVITPRKFNEDIANWIAETNVRGDWKNRVDAILRRHINDWGSIEQLDSQGQGQYTQWASPINESNLNEWTMLARGGATGHWPGISRTMFNADLEGLNPNSRHFASRHRDYTRASDPTRDQWTGDQLIPESLGPQMHSGRVEAAESRMRAAMIGNPYAKRDTLSSRATMYENNKRFQNNLDARRDDGSKINNMEDRMFGLSMGRAMLSGARGKSSGWGAGRTGKFWGLEEYLSRDTQEGFNDSVNARWWAAPYISLLYPSGQVSSAT